ncbi:Cuticle-degrading protease [Purpureocillium lavendulum]|uniref:Cuticle-degrading protease n=1 Tax=Purpureocillium lavendulum TaxID=1247861 RepID=A0AB34FIS1_9HYPO|nr:Cuticle-degrading protease [Purpureocillium lavendulum]
MAWNDSERPTPRASINTVAAILPLLSPPAVENAGASLQMPFGLADDRHLATRAWQLSLLLAILPLALAAPAPVVVKAKRSEPAPLLTPRGSTVIPDKYIVKFKQDSALSLLDDALNMITGDADRVYRDAFRGFTSTLNETMLSSFRDLPEVEYVEKDSISSISGVVEQRGAPWGLGRISHREKGSDTYVYDESAGAGVCAYVIDTGIDDSIQDFGGRTQQVRSFVQGQDTDNNGHGTHVAGTIGSNTYGVAKAAKIYGVKVLDGEGNGSNSNIIAGMNFVVEDAKKRECPKGVVVNMSLGGEYSQALNEAAAALVNAGLFLGVAAGNDNSDAGNYSPASEPSACTVGGTAVDDTRYADSNWGQVVDILAPGAKVTSLRPGGGEATMSGTSMATPHVVGLAAYLSTLEGLTGTQALCDRIRELAIRDAIVDQPQGTVNLLAFNGATQ